MNLAIVKAINIHFAQGAETCGLELYPEGTLKDEDSKQQWLEIRVSDFSKKLISQQYVVDLAVNILYCVKSGTTAKTGFSLYKIEELLGCVESMFTPIRVPGLGCLDFPPDQILGLQVERPREVKTGLIKAGVTGFYRMEVIACQ